MWTVSRHTSRVGPAGCRSWPHRRGKNRIMGISASIVFLPGDGVGPEIVDATGLVMNAVEHAFGHALQTQTVLIGGAAIDAYGTPLRAEDLETCKAADAVLL